MGDLAESLLNEIYSIVGKAKRSSLSESWITLGIFDPHAASAKGGKKPMIHETTHFRMLQRKVAVV